MGASSVTVTTIRSPIRSAATSTQPGPTTVAVEDHVRRRLVDRLDEVVHARFRRVARAGHLSNEVAHVGHVVKLCRDAQRPARTERHARRAKSAVERLMNRPWPFLPVNSPFRTITEPRDRTTSLAPWTSRPS